MHIMPQVLLHLLEHTLFVSTSLYLATRAAPGFGIIFICCSQYVYVPFMQLLKILICSELGNLTQTSKYSVIYFVTPFMEQCNNFNRINLVTVPGVAVHLLP